MKQIFSYEDYLSDSAFADRSLGARNLANDNPLKLFDSYKDAICPFCKTSTNEVHKKSLLDFPEWLENGYYLRNESVFYCNKCGWWRIRTYKETTGDLLATSSEIKNAVLRKYDLSDKNIPIQCLQNYLKNKFDDVIHIHEKQMEKLVQSVFSEHFTCNVEHIGKSHDGGIDLILVQSNKPIVVQDKRRMKLSHVEGVSGIRELLGATLLKGSKNCIYVSTSQRFSEQSKIAAQKSVEDGHLESYELYDFSRFSEALKLTKRTNHEPWLKFLEIKD